MTSGEPLLAVEGLEAAYGNIRALRGVSLHVDEGEAVALIGANGAGKTTLMRTIMGLLRPRAGAVRLGDRDVTGWSTERLVNAGVVLVPEGRQVFPGLTVRDNLVLGGYRRRRSAAVDTELAEVCDLFPVLADRAAQLAGTLSGGEQQMVAIGRALMAQPRILLLDEPSLGLAPLAIREVVDKLGELVRRDTTLLLVEQNARAAMQVATRGYVLQRGQVVVEGTTAQLLADPDVHAAYLGGEVEVSEERSAPASSSNGSADPAS